MGETPFYQVLLDLSLEALAAGHHETAGHLVCAAAHSAFDLHDEAGLANVAQAAKNQAHWLEQAGAAPSLALISPRIEADALLARLVAERSREQAPSSPSPRPTLPGPHVPTQLRIAGTRVA
jgi:hypothetical protein